MPVGKYKKRITITLPIKQYQWLLKTAESWGISPSKLISRQLEKIRDELFIPQDGIQGTWKEMDLKEMIRIAKTPWLEEDDE